jgi:hypothetical protein
MIGISDPALFVKSKNIPVGNYQAIRLANACPNQSWMIPISQLAVSVLYVILNHNNNK